MESPAAVYSRLLVESRTRLAHEQKWDRRLGYGKVAVFLTGALAAVLLLHSPSLLWLLLIPVAVFVVLAVAHDRVLRRVRDSERAVEFYARGVARLQDNWAGTGETGERFLDPNHPYARDLDLFGKASLFELLNTVRTRAGEETLARWLLHPAPPDEVLERQAAVADMKERLEFRERLFATGESVQAGVHPEALAGWGEQAPAIVSRWRLGMWTGLAAVWLAGVGYWLSGGSWHPLLFISAVNFSVSYAMHRRVTEAGDAIEKATNDLRVLAEVLALIEQERFRSARLNSLQASLTMGHMAPSVAVKKLGRIVDWLESRHNMFVRLFEGFTFYTPWLVTAAGRWQLKFGPSIRGWVSAVGEFETLSALAGYAWEHPDDVVPEFTDEQPFFEAEALAHPLLPAAGAVGNDLQLSHDMRLIVISGPNMAGKSTFLRAVGLNAVLAQCGAPVRARRLRLSQLAVGASICVLDSLQGGVSRFYAEIRRLKLLSDLAEGPAPLLFLLDELLSGTNSHDRLDGTRFVVQALLRRGAVGLVTTHDLALTGIPETMDGLARNCHFEDRIENGRLQFDYRLKPGVVRTSNALKLMQAVGLDVGEPR